jgi:2-dehydropantoate 2-reductase
MASARTTYILGSGAVGFPLAVYLANAGRKVVAVRTSRNDVSRGTVTATVQNGPNRVSAAVETVSLSKLTSLDGLIVIAAKSYVNRALAGWLKEKAITGSLVIMQNGAGVEKPFLDARIAPVYRCVLYVTGQARSEYDFEFRPITDSRIGIVTGDEAGLKQCVEALTTGGFPFVPEGNIRREVWKKTIVNSVFNSICPLLETDNGIFIRSAAAAELAGEVIVECVAVTDRLEMGLGEREIMEQIMLVSRKSEGQLISTLQDLRAGRETEIESLNLEIVRVAASMQPPLRVPKTEVLGQMISAKSMLGRR